METRSRADYANSHASQPDVRGHVGRNTNHRRFRPCGLEGESPQLQPAHPRPTIPTTAYVARLVVCHRCVPNDVPPVPRPVCAPDLPVQVASSALLSFTESLFLGARSEGKRGSDAIICVMWQSVWTALPFSSAHIPSVSKVISAWQTPHFRESSFASFSRLVSRRTRFRERNKSKSEAGADVPPVGPEQAARIWLATEATDMRCGFGCLAERVRAVVGQAPLSGGLFVFRSRRGDRLKILLWDRATDFSFGTSVWRLGYSSHPAYRKERARSNCERVS